MTHKEKTKMLYKELKDRHPNIDSIMVETFMQKMPEEAYISLLFYENEENENYHITTKEQYNKGVELFEWVEKRGTGAKWACEDIIKLSNINFEEKEYTKHDFCYVMNMLWSDACNVFQEPSYYLKMTKNYLEDPDYYGNPSERAYCDIRKRIKHSFAED